LVDDPQNLWQQTGLHQRSPEFGGKALLEIGVFGIRHKAHAGPPLDVEPPLLLPTLESQGKRRSDGIPLLHLLLSDRSQILQVQANEFLRL